MKHKLLCYLLFFPIILTAQIKIGFLDFNDALNTEPEIKAAYNLFSSNKNFSIEKISSSTILNTQFSIKKYQIIWIHRPDSTELTNEETNPIFITRIQKYVKEGGKLFLTLNAMKYLNALGLETEKPTTTYVEAIDDGYGRKLGLHSFRFHPIFNGLNGGAYIFNPAQDMKTQQIGFFGESIPQNGKVIAVDWSYINLKEESRLVLEYNFGRGRVLAVGAYLFFGIKNNSRDHLELFTKNCLNYLTGKYEKEKKYYWEYKRQEVLQSDEKLNRVKQVKISKSKEWRKHSESLKLSNISPGENFWNVAGQRMLVMGKEKAGIDEIWAHPFMALRDYEVGLTKGDSVKWLRNYPVKVKVGPESFTRSYQLENSTLTEIITTSITEPTAVIHYELRGGKSAQLVVKYKSNLRFMWPYTEKSNGSIYYNWSAALNAFVVKDRSGDFVSIVGSNKKPVLKNIGQYENYDSVSNGIVTDKIQISALLKFNLELNDNFDIVISATNEGMRKTASVYGAAISNAQKIYETSVDYTQKFFNNSMMISTPDKNFNKGYKWSLIGADKFFVNTPGLGKSLVAGYSTTAKGWGGNHKINGRPGYAWYFGRDGCWSGFALLDYGDFEKVKSILEFFNKYQDLNGKIFHELTTSGAVHYDASDATPLYIILAGKYLKHTGDVEFIKQTWPHIKKAIDFCYSTDTDKDQLIENTNVGHGWVEGGGLYTAHTEVYLAACWSAALREASNMADQIGLSTEHRAYREESERVKKIINDEFWNDETNFLNFSKMKDGKFNPEKTVLAAVPVYFNMLEKNKAKKVVDAYAENYFSSDWGVRILREDSPIFNPRGYHTGSVWPLFTGWSSLAEYKNGNYIQGYTHIMNNLLVFKNWQLGYIEEVLNGAEYKPSGVCSQQAWSETMVLQPAIEGMLGLEVDASRSKLVLSPRFPADWDSIKVERISIGKSLVNFEMKRRNGKTDYKFTTNSQLPIHIEFNPSFSPGTKIISHLIESKSFSVMPLENSTIQITFLLNKASRIVLEHSKGISVLPNIILPIPNDVSKGFRILSDKLNGNVYSVEVQGKSGSDNELQVYVADGKISSVENGKIISSDKSIYNIAVEFENKSAKYSNKTILIKME